MVVVTFDESLTCTQEAVVVTVLQALQEVKTADADRIQTAKADRIQTFLVLFDFNKHFFLIIPFKSLVKQCFYGFESEDIDEDAAG